MLGQSPQPGERVPLHRGIFGKKGKASKKCVSEHDHILLEMTSWFCRARDNEIAVQKGELTQPSFEKAFHRSVALKQHPQGSATKMVDVSIKPLPMMDDEDHYIPENCIVTTTCFCQNSLIGVWKILVENKGDDVLQWTALSYPAILYQGGRNMNDCITQQKRQKLFYSRMKDILAAKPDQKCIRFELALKVYQEDNEVGVDESSEKNWKMINRSHWKHWKLSAIHVLVADSTFAWCLATRSLVERLGIRIAGVTDTTTTVLRELLDVLWREGKAQRPYWKKVTQDRALFFFPMKNSHSILSGLDRTFGLAGEYRPTGELLSSIVRNIKGEERRKLEKADAEIKRQILDLLNEGNTGEKISTKVAYQPSFIMSAVHDPQHPHFDYRGKDWKTNKYWIGFLPITDYGQYLQLWEYGPENEDNQKGEIVFIPKGQLVLVRGDTLHGGGFRAETNSGNHGAHGRIHFYIYPDVDQCQIDIHGNEYNDPKTKGRTKMAKQYLNNDLLCGVVEGGAWSETMNWCFFQGECPIDKKTGVELKVSKKRNR